MIRLMIALALCCPLLTAQQATVSSIFKDPVIGNITKLDVQGRLEVEVKGSDVPERVPLDETEEISFGHKGDERKPEEAPLRVYLVNGDVLHGSPEEGPEDDEEVFVIKGTRFGTLRINIDAVKRIEVVKNVQPNVLPEPEEKKDVTYFASMGDRPAEADPASELVRIVKDGVYLYNEFLDDDNYAGTKFPWSALRGVVCYRSDHTPYTKLLGIFTLRDGSVIRGVVKNWGEGKVTLTHNVLKEDIALEENALISVTMKNGKYLYLSDMEFAGKPEERPYFLPGDFNYDDYLFKVRRDQAQGGGAISIGGKVFAKGLGVHSLSRLTFDLNRGFKRFISVIGLDDTAGELGDVEFKIYADDKLVYESGVLRRSAGAKSIDIDVLNVSKLVLEVTAGGDDDVLDRANWANAKAVR
ncbi:MAG: NPCBM/NEW2 domain-containing protein [Planctomycetes bacterium]|nr:NPCBM/NEW2 domain-containing protein [Planctomycetota bacterium]